MKLYKTLLAALLLTATAATVTSCSEDEEMAPVSIPVSSWKANTTIADLKTAYWQSDDNYYKEVGLTASGEHTVISGRVIGNDLTGNIYQTLMIQDATGALNISVAVKDMNVRYKIGEEVVIDCTGLFVGKYSGLFCLGKDEIYDRTQTPQVGRMDESVWVAHNQLNGLPKPSAIVSNEITLEQIKNLKSTEDLVKWQSQRVRISNVSFEGGGELTWGEQGSSSTAVNRYLFDSDGNRITVRNSNMSTFCDQVMPAGHGTVEAILSYFGGGWQLVFVTNEDCFDFGGESYAPVPLPNEGKGTAEEPYNVGSVVNGIASGADKWVTGYIVGWIEGMSATDGANFTVPASSASNLLLADSPDEKNVGNCIPVQLPTGDVRNALNLQSHPENLGKQVSLKGSVESYFGMKGLKSVAAYVWGPKGDDSAEPETPETPEGSSTFRKATSVTSGAKYIIVVDGKLGAAISPTAAYGRLEMKDVTISGDELTADDANAITIEAVDGGYTLTDAYGRKLAMDSSHLTSFQLDYAGGEVWSIEPQDGGLFKITSLLNPSCCIVRSGTYSNIAPSDIEKYPTYDLPALYEKVN